MHFQIKRTASGRVKDATAKRVFAAAAAAAAVFEDPAAVAARAAKKS